MADSRVAVTQSSKIEGAGDSRHLPGKQKVITRHAGHRQAS